MVKNSRDCNFISTDKHRLGVNQLLYIGDLKVNRFLILLPLISLLLAIFNNVSITNVGSRNLSVLNKGEGQVELNGITHWYKIAGVEHSKTPIVVIHGGPGGNIYNFERTIGPKLEAFAKVIYYEQRGSGRSASPEDSNAYSIPILVSDLEILRQRLGLEKIIPLGFSFGGELALEYALAYPNHVEKLIVQAPSLGRGKDIGSFFNERMVCVQLYGFLRVAKGDMSLKIRKIITEKTLSEKRLEKVWEMVNTETVDRFLFHNDEVAKMNRKLWRESGLVNTGEMFKALAKQPRGVPLLNRVHLIRVPTLVIVGLYDRNVGIESCRDVATLIPRARLMVFEHSAHFPDMEETEKYAQTVYSFLQE